MATITDDLPLQTTELQGSMPLDLPAVASAFGRRLRDAGSPVTPAQSERFVLSLALVKPVSRHALYWTTRAVFVTGPRQLATFDRVFGDVFASTSASKPFWLVSLRIVPASALEMAHDLVGSHEASGSSPS